MIHWTSLVHTHSPSPTEQVIFSIICEGATESATFKSSSAHRLPLMCQMDNEMLRLICAGWVYYVELCCQSEADFIHCFVTLRFQAHIQLQRFAKNLVLIRRLSGANASRSNSQGLDVQLSVLSRSRKKKGGGDGNRGGDFRRESKRLREESSLQNENILKSVCSGLGGGGG